MSEAREYSGTDTEFAQRIVHNKLAWCARKQILTAQYVRDVHECVIDRVDECVERVTIGAHDNEVGYVFGFERHLAPDKVVPGVIGVGHTHAYDDRSPRRFKSRALISTEITTGAVIAGRALFGSRQLSLGF